MKLNYVIDKIKHAPFKEYPFRHIEINNIFDPGDFANIVGAREIAINDIVSDDQLFDELLARGYRVIEHPGCITNIEEYKRWRAGKSEAHDFTNTTCEGFGIAYRLTEPKSEPIQNLLQLLGSEAFKSALAIRFDIDMASTNYDAGIQKYLDGYEISPHPDIRRKALTFMLNINPSVAADMNRHHTHYLRLKRKYEYVRVFWENNPEMDRAWVPWDWCDSCKIQNENNSLVIFQPDDATMHGVKANYDHLKYQRTQLYGNLWYRHSLTSETPSWTDLRIRESDRGSSPSVYSRLVQVIPRPLKRGLKGLRNKFSSSVRLHRDL